MLVFGNLLLLIATLCYLHLCNMLYFRSMPGGDAAVGYAWSLLFGVVFYFGALLGTAAIVGSSGGFAWVADTKSSRILWVLLALFVAVLGNGFLMFGEFPHPLPPTLKTILDKIPIISPLMMIIAMAILLNTQSSKYPALLYQIPIGISLFTGLLGVGVLLFHKVQRQAAMLEEHKVFHDQVHQNHLNQIDTTDIQKDFILLMVFTDGSQDQVVREKAIAKIKTRADWEEELIRRLSTDWAPEVFTFLSSNDVDHPEKFVEPIASGARIQARLIRETIRRCRGEYDLHSGSFSWEILRMLRTIERFNHKGTDYRPLVQEVLMHWMNPPILKNQSWK